MTPPTDTLKVSLRAVPSVHDCHRDDPDMCCYDVIDTEALAVAVREWIRGALTGTAVSESPTEARGYGRAMNDVARNLGLA